MPAAAKSPKRRRGRLKMSTSCSYSPFPGPRYGGRPPEMYPKISGAQNLSGVPVFNPGHWALGEQKFQSVRFHCRAWLCRTNAPSPFSAVGAAPCGRPSLAFPLQGGRWLAEGQTDEGAGFGLNWLCTGKFRRLRAASFFPSDGKETNGPGHLLLPLRGNSP